VGARWAGFATPPVNANTPEGRRALASTIELVKSRIATLLKTNSAYDVDAMSIQEALEDLDSRGNAGAIAYASALGKFVQRINMGSMSVGGGAGISAAYSRHEDEQALDFVRDMAPTRSIEVGLAGVLLNGHSLEEGGYTWAGAAQGFDLPAGTYSLHLEVNSYARDLVLNPGTVPASQISSTRFEKDGGGTLLVVQVQHTGASSDFTVTPAAADTVHIKASLKGAISIGDVQDLGTTNAPGLYYAMVTHPGVGVLTGAQRMLSAAALAELNSNLVNGETFLTAADAFNIDRVSQLEAANYRTWYNMMALTVVAWRCSAIARSEADSMDS
jgi:hypothetical protein